MGGLSVNMAALLSVLIQPYMPNMAANLENQLAVPKGRLTRLPRALHCILPAGHTIGTPSPLVEEIKPALVEQLKSKHQGKQSERGSAPEAEKATTAPAVKTDAGKIAELEAEVAAQGSKVREVKASKADKSVVDAEVKLLLELKQKLAAAQGTPAPAAAEGKGGKKGKKK